MSLAMGGLAAAAAFVEAVFLMTAYYGSGRQLNYAVAYFTSWSLVVGIGVHGPLNCWDGRTWRWTVVCILVSCVLPGLLNAWMTDNFFLLDPVACVAVGFAIAYLGNGLLRIRLHRSYFAAYLISVCGAAIPAVVLPRLPDPIQLTEVSGSREIAEFIWLTLLFASGLAPITIPWGFPHWWPPAEDESLPESIERHDRRNRSVLKTMRRFFVPPRRER
jgi:hypothetical protein